MLKIETTSDPFSIKGECDNGDVFTIDDFGLRLKFSNIENYSLGLKYATTIWFFVELLPAKAKRDAEHPSYKYLLEKLILAIEKNPTAEAKELVITAIENAILL